MRDIRTNRFRSIAVAALALGMAWAGTSQAEPSGPVPDYLDDRSKAASVVGSLYNAVNRGEYLRAWSYFSENDAPDYETFRNGYEATSRVRVKTGEETSEGAAGSIYYSLPVAVEATADDGSVEVFTGCYQLRLVQPAVQETPPFRPLGIEEGRLEKSDTSFDDAAGNCPEAGLQ